MPILSLMILLDTLRVLTWKEGVKEGIGEEYYYDPPYNLHKRFQIINNKTWLLEAYYPDGQLNAKYVDTTVNDSIIKKFIEFSINGSIELIGFYNGEIKTGKWTWYYNNGKIKSICNYRNGKLNGSYKYFYKNGQLWTERIFKNDLLLDVISSYNVNGKPNNPGTLSNGNGLVYLYDS